MHAWAPAKILVRGAGQKRVSINTKTAPPTWRKKVTKGAHMAKKTPYKEKNIAKRLPYTEKVAEKHLNGEKGPHKRRKT